MPALQPDTEQMRSFAKDDHDGPIIMVNLLKFREKAAYPDDAPEAKENLTGEQAYDRYGEGLVELGNDPEIGPKLLYGGPVAGFLIGTGDWDRVLVVRYPSRQHMLRMMRDPRYREAHRHREAGLLHQDLIETRGEG